MRMHNAQMRRCTSAGQRDGLANAGEVSLTVTSSLGGGSPDSVFPMLWSDNLISLVLRQAAEEVHLVRAPEIKKIAKSRTAGHGLPFPTWSLATLARHLLADTTDTSSAPATPSSWLTPWSFPPQ
jgi:hypothetical protein